MAAPPGPLASARLRPRTVGEILDASFVLYRRRFGSLLLATTILSLPTLVVAIVLSEPAGLAFHDYMGAATDYFRASARSAKPDFEAFDRVMDAMPGVQLYALVSSLMQALSRGGACVAGALVAAAAVRGEPTPGTWALVRASLPYVAAATFVHSALALAGVIAGGCCILLPGVLLLTAALAPACAMLVLERAPSADRVRAWDLPPVIGPVVRGIALPFAQTGHVLGRAFRLSLHAMTLVRGTFCTFAVLVLVSIVVSVVVLLGGWGFRSFGVAYVLQHYAEVIFLPVIGLSFALWYFDLRVRREGADLERAA